MTKAILVVDMPNCCTHCTFCNDETGFCKALGAYINNVSNTRYQYCPLKTMPEKKYVEEIKEVNDFMKTDIQIMNDKIVSEIMLDTDLLLASGYNKCIDEILGEE